MELFEALIFKSAERIKEAKAAPVSSQSEAEIPPDNRRPPPPPSLSLLSAASALCKTRKLAAIWHLRCVTRASGSLDMGTRGRGTTRQGAEWGIFQRQYLASSTYHFILKLKYLYPSIRPVPCHARISIFWLNWTKNQKNSKWPIQGISGK